MRIFIILFFFVLINAHCSTPNEVRSNSNIKSEESAVIAPTNLETENIFVHKDGRTDVIDGGQLEKLKLDSNVESNLGSLIFLKTMYRNLNYPAIARENGVQGGCSLEVIINEIGELEEARITRDIGAGCGKAALAAFKIAAQSGFKAGILNGKPVKTKHIIPVNFKLG